MYGTSFLRQITCYIFISFLCIFFIIIIGRIILFSWGGGGGEGGTKYFERFEELKWSKGRLQDF